MSLKDNEVKFDVIRKFQLQSSLTDISSEFNIPHQTLSDFLLRKSWKDWWLDYDEKVDSGIVQPTGPKILTLDIETSPILGQVWGQWQQNLGLNMIVKDWYVISWAAKWFHEDTVMYEDKKDSWDTEDDSELLLNIWKLLDEADINCYTEW